jgi:hypothetical protein
MVPKQDGEGNKTLFIDSGVYSRNRAFRLFLSSKAGKAAVLLPTGAPWLAYCMHEAKRPPLLLCMIDACAEMQQIG